MKKSVLFYFIVILIVTLAGCKRDDPYDPVFEDDNHLVMIRFSSKSLSGSVTKATTSGSVEENRLDKIIIFGVDAQNDVIDTFSLVNPLSTEVRTISRKIKALYAIANPSGDMESELESWALPFLLSDLTNLTGDFSLAPASPFLMGGYGNIIGSGATVSVNIDLIRTVARIDFVADNGFEIDSIYVRNTPDAGYVFKKEPLSIPLSVGWINYDGIEYLPMTTDTTVYVAENLRQHPTQFRVSGIKDQKRLFYTFELTMSGQAIDILRNTRYQVGITPLTDTECSITLSIPEWEDEETDPIGVDDTPAYPDYSSGIKILAIGNSYSENSIQYMYDLLKQLGVDEADEGNIKVVAAYISGGSLHDHAENARNGTYSNLLRITSNVGGVLNYDWYSYSILAIIQQEDWDVITLQQASEYSGNASTYDTDLDYLIDYVQTKATNPNFKLGWHMTWAWENGYSEYGTYYGDQQTMYQAICNAVQTKIKLKKNGGPFDLIIPSGTAIQNARGIDGDIFNSDYTHLSNGGRYIAAATWIKTITGYDIANLIVPYTASSLQYGAQPETIDQTDLNNVVQAVNAATASPFTSP